MAPNPWTSLDSSQREAVADVLGRLIHDWIKAMEMWLLSVDWSAPPADAPALLGRAVRQTRKWADGARSARQMLEAARAELGGSGGEPARAWWDELEGELAAIEALCGLDLAALARLGGEIEAHVRAPGRRLRQARAELPGGGP